MRFEPEAPIRARERLPDRRDSDTFKINIGDEQVYITIGYYPLTGSEIDARTDSQLPVIRRRPGEVFLTLNKAGSATRGWADLCATFVSILLQHGIPIETIIEKLRGTRFDPSGITSYPDIPIASSIPDFLGHMMELEFLGQSTSPKIGEFCPECGGPLIHQERCLRCASCGYERC